MIQNQDQAQPDEKPWLTILGENIYCYQRYLTAKDPGGTVLFDDAARWIFNAHDDWQYSFDNVCRRLGLNPAGLRDDLLQWRAEMLRAREARYVSQAAAAAWD